MKGYIIRTATLRRASLVSFLSFHEHYCNLYHAQQKFTEKPIEKTALFRVFREIHVQKKSAIDLRNPLLERTEHTEKF
jgi:hypothetical protein